MQNEEKWITELMLLRSIIQKTPLFRTIKWGAEVFTWNGRNVLSYGGFRNYFALWFYNGVFLTDKDKLLVSAQEGKTKSLRQWRFSSAKEIDEAKILAYIQEAIEVERKGLKIKPEKFQPLELPVLLEEAIRNDDRLSAGFKKLSPGKQKEYIVYLLEAKQEQTRNRRLEKIMPGIMQGIGLNDKYK
ncbi:MAG TPA: YdeI/OmpD-associated family protein [Bacteroidales bacterium]|nr:YdeI/OmpD-associated family protein [Bacteroidales bacterium]HRZ49002.1 YdeI/OmpD-associated family protein [Bacteroidales bacterium]